MRIYECNEFMTQINEDTFFSVQSLVQQYTMSVFHSRLLKETLKIIWSQNKIVLEEMKFLPQQRKHVF